MEVIKMNGVSLAPFVIIIIASVIGKKLECFRMKRPCNFYGNIRVVSKILVIIARLIFKKKLNFKCKLN